jgi:hypothetical protein
MAEVRLQLSFWAMLGWVVVIDVLMGAAGAWPTWHLAGWKGLTGELVAGAIVIPIMLASALVVLRGALRGPGAAVKLFVAGWGVRLPAVVALALLLGFFCRLHLAAFLCWVGLFYLAAIVGEGFWLAKALKRDAFLVALGRIHRPSPPSS